MGRNERRLRKKFMQNLLHPYRVIASRTDDREAAAAINGLISMVEHASRIMDEHAEYGPPDPNEAAFLDEVNAALDEDDDERIAQIVQRKRGGK